MSEEELKHFEEWAGDGEEIVVDSDIWLPLTEEIRRLQQENQQLKEQVTLLKASEPMLELTKYYGERDLYKSVLKEIREVLKGHFSTYASCVKALDEIEEIIDKGIGEDK